MVRREALAGLVLASGLCVVGFFRVYVHHDTVTAAAISLSMFLIVLCATLAGTLLPLGLHAGGWDPAHAGPAIQVVMDISGVLITCAVCSVVLVLGPTPLPVDAAAISAHME